MKHYFYSFLFFSLFIISCQSQNNNFESVSPTGFSEKLKQIKNPQLLDVRTPEEYDSQHIEKAINVNWNSNEFSAKANKYDKTKPVFVYCLSGGRSKKAASKLHELGFKEIYELEGGIMKWNASGFSKPSDKIIGMSKSEYDKLLVSDKKVLVDFYAEWCGPCKKMAPYLKKMESEFKNKLTIIRIDVDKNKTLINELKIEGLPVLKLYDNQKEIWNNVGYISEKDLKKQLKL